jgi:hypothetical protein
VIGGLFVDGPNLAGSLHRAGVLGAPRRIDFGALPKVLSRVLSPEGGLIDFRFMAYYGAFRHERDEMRRKDFVAMLGRLGWTVFETKAKECHQWRSCPTCKQEVPAGEVFYLDKQTDISVALDAYKLVLREQIGVLVVVTNDGDFAALFKRLDNKVRAVVVGWRLDMAAELRETAPEHLYMDDLMEDIAYRP